MNTTKAWYIRSQSNKAITGPFPGGQISREILLGRHKMDDEVSHDKEEWLILRDVPELVPEVFTENKNDPRFNDRLAAARRWADERRGIADIDTPSERRANSSYENDEIKRLHRLANEAKSKTNPLATVAQVAIAFVIIIIVISLAFQYSPDDKKSTTDCTSPAQQGVDWNGCDLSGTQLVKVNLIAANLMSTNLQTSNLYGADLSHANLQYAQLHLSNLKYVNFTKANLKGTSLVGADLSNAILSQSNLSYANLRDAIINAADFSNARLDHAIWVDGRTCRINSIGSCN